jgi:RNA 2',3'-cyclic 3'-phosphodiesterase
MPSSPNIRLFVAAYPPPEARAAYAQALDQLDAGAPYRATPTDQIHMTLQFIGAVPQKQLDDVIESVNRSAAGIPAFALTPQCLVCFPERGTPRLIALETDNPPGLQEVRRRLVQRLAKEPRRENTEHFRPHLTLCRFTGAGRPRRIDEPATRPPFTVEALILFQSTLKPTGAIYTEVARAPLS